MKALAKVFKNKKTRLLAILSINIATLSAAVVISTLSWFKQDVSIGPVDNVPGSILTSYFDKNDLPEGFDENVYPHGSSANPYVITRPVHYYNLVRLQELGTYGFGPETYFQFGKQFGKPRNVDDPDGTTYPFKFYSYSDNGVFLEGSYTPYLNMKYYKDSNALAPIGSARRPFEGHIMGNFLTVQNLYVNGGGFSDIGIFGYVGQTAYIQNLYFDDVHIDAAKASAIAPGSIGHVAHSSHVYVGYLAGHIYDTSKFSHVYVNDCHITNTTGNEYEMINTFGFFGHTDEPLGSSSDTSGYTSQLVAENAYNAIEFSSSLGGTSPLARRYTPEPSAGNLSDALSDYTPSGQSTYYTIDTNNATGKPYSLSSIGYSSGDAGTFKYARYNTGTDQDRELHEIGNVESQNVLSEKPKYIEYYDADGNPLPEPIDHSDNPIYDFYGMNDGAYIYYDSDSKWKYVNVEADTDNPVTGTVQLYCHTISFEQTVNSVTKKFFLKYQAAGDGDEYDTLVPVEWNSNTPPQTDEFYFCFKTSFGHSGVSRFVECSADSEYYIYSPVGQKYLCTYSPKTPGSAEHVLDGQYLHTPVFVPQEGYAPANATGSNKWSPMKFTLGGPKTSISYKAPDNADSLTDGLTANAQFNRNVNRAHNTRGALQGSNITHQFGLFGGHKMVSGANGGEFTIGDYIENQTTSLNNGVNYKLTSEAKEIVNYSTLVIAGFEGEQTNTYSIDYALGSQMDNNRDAQVVREVRDTSGYVLNDTTGVAKLIFKIVGGSTSSYNYDPIFTIESTDGFLCFPDSRAFSNGSGSTGNNYLRSYTAAELAVMDNGKTMAKEEFSKWKFAQFAEPGYYTRYRFQNVGNPDRYLCYNIERNIFATYSLNEYLSDEDCPEGTTFFSQANTASVLDYNGYANSRCWFYIYKQQHGQTIQNVHYTVARIISAPGTIYPFKKTVTPYPLMVSEISNSPTDPQYYEDFDVDPSYNVYFNTTTSQVQYFEAYVRVWKRVNLVSELQEGDTVMIGTQTTTSNNGGPTQHYFMGSQASNYRNRSSAVTFKPPYVQADDVPTNAATFTLTKSDRGWRFDTGSGFLYAAGGTSNNYLRTENQPDSNGNADWSISILTDGTANIVSQGRNVTRNKIQYYQSSSWWSSSYYFSCFSGSQRAIQLYRLAQSSADRSTYVGDLIDKFESFRMDAIGPNIEYHTDYMKMNQEPSISNGLHLNEGDLFYPSSHFKNAITLLIDANGSRDLGTLKFECRFSNSSNMPYFYLYDGSHYRLDTAQAIDKDSNQNDNVHSFLLNINATNIDALTYYHIKGEGYYSADYKPGNDNYGKEFKVCSSEDENLTKYLVVLAAPSGCEITNVTFTFNAVPGNIGYPGPVDYRSATYDANGFFTGTVENGQMVEETALCIYYDVKELLQQLTINVTFDHSTNTYYVTIDTSNSVLTQDISVNIFKYDNTATNLVVVLDGVSTQYDEGTVSILVPANTTPPSP